MNIAVIPARGGSQRIPNKSIKSFLGKPIISYSIQTCLESGLFDKVIVSTDSEEIKSVAEKFGAEVPFMRPAELSDNHTGLIPVVNHSVAWLKDNNIQVETVCCVLATAPLLQSHYLKQAYDIFKSQKPNFVVSVCSFDYPIQRALKKSGESVEMFWPENFDKRSQDLEPAFHDAAQFYLGTPESFSSEGLFSKGSRAIEIPKIYVQDIDTNEDWIQAELAYNILQRAEA